MAAFLLVATWLEMAKDNALQSWLENCIFGVGNSYQEGEQEMKDLTRALS